MKEIKECEECLFDKDRCHFRIWNKAENCPMFKDKQVRETMKLIKKIKD